MADVIIGKSSDGLRHPILTDATGAIVVANPVSSIGNVETILNTQTGIETTMAADLAAIQSATQSVAGFSIPAHDYLALGYTGNNLTTVTYKVGGANGTTVGTLTLAYDGSGNLTSITKS